MALQAVNLLLGSLGSPYATTSTGAVVDAAGEFVGVVGYVNLPGRTGTKTISSAGGQLIWRPTAVTAFANAGTTLRLGLQDVTLTTGFGDGTYDVSADLIGGTDTITANTYMRTAMETGTKTLSQGQLIAVRIEMNARGGADSLAVGRCGIGWNSVNRYTVPYGEGLTTASPAKSTADVLFVVIEFDDGTTGFIQGCGLFLPTLTSTAVNSGSTPDEYCGTFTLPYKAQVCGIGSLVDDVATGEDFEIVLYSDPYGTPTVVATAVIDPDVQGAGTSVATCLGTITPTTLAAGVYGIAVRPTTAGSITVSYATFTSGTAAGLRAVTTMPGAVMATRTNQTGAFTDITDTFPLLLLDICALDDGAGGSGGEVAYPYIG